MEIRSNSLFFNSKFKKKIKKKLLMQLFYLLVLLLSIGDGTRPKLLGQRHYASRQDLSQVCFHIYSKW